MAQCPSCSFENAAGMRFCGACGTRLPNSCPSCGFENPPDFRFCGACGTALRGLPVPPAASVVTPVAVAPPAPAASPSAATSSTAPATTVSVTPVGASLAAGAPTSPRSDAERRHLTVLFCDLVDSTALAERLDAEEYRDLVRRYQDTCATIVRRLDGHIAQYLGDGLLVYFGYPRAHEDDARRAGHAALGIADAIRALPAQHGTESPLAVRIGIHTGPVVAGDMGDAGRGERLALGSTPNIAARLQALAPPNAVLLSGDTAQLLHGWFDLEGMGLQELRGVSRPVVVHRMIREARRSGRFELDDASRLSPMIGRDEEQALLSRRLRSTLEGAGHTLLLSGEAGVGKSRLVQAVRAEAVAAGFTCLIGRCAAVHQESPLLPLVELLEGMLGIDADSKPGDRLARIEQQTDTLGMSRAETVPLIGALLSVPTGHRYPPLDLLAHKQRARTFETLLAMLVRSAEQRPIAFVMEDLHWADPSTLEFVALFVSQPPVPHLLSLFTVRGEFPLPWAARSNVTHLTLSRLGDRDVRELIANLAGDLRLPADVVRQVVQKTDGIPVFVEELTRMVLELGLVEGGAPVDPASLAPLLDIPNTLQDSLLARLDRMGDAKEIAQVGAVLGRVFTYELLLAVAGFDEETLQRHLTTLVDAELLYQRGTLPSATFTFKHALLQDAAYGLLLRTTRRVLHGRIADTLQTVFPALAAAQPEVVAHHLTEAGRAEQAILAWQQVGMHSLMRSANVEAVRALTRGRALLADIADPGRRMSYELGVLTTLGAAYVSTMGYGAPDTAATFARAAELCETLGEVPELFWAVRGVWSATLTAGDLPKSLELGERLLRAAEQANDDDVRMEAHYALGSSHMFMGTLAAARDHFARVIELDHAARATTGRMYTAVDVVVTAHALAAQTAWLLHEPEAAGRLIQRSLALAAEIHHPLSHAFALNQAATVAYHDGDREMARRYATENVRLSEQYGTFFAPIAGIWLGWADDDPDAATRMFEAHSMSGARVGNSMFYAILAETRWRAGDVTGANAAIAAGLDAVRDNGEHFWEPELLRLRGEIARGDGRANDAARDFRESIAAASRTGAAALEARARRSLLAVVPSAA